MSSMYLHDQVNIICISRSIMVTHSEAANHHVINCFFLKSGYNFI